MSEFPFYVPFLFPFVLILAYFYWRRQPVNQVILAQIRRARVAQKHHDVEVLNPRRAVSGYYATFEILETGERITFPLNLDEFVFLNEGESGNLASQGSKFLEFESDTPRKNRLEEEDVIEDDDFTKIKIHCEECKEWSVFHLKKLGTVQQCAHCRAYIDVENQL